MLGVYGDGSAGALTLDNVKGNPDWTTRPPDVPLEFTSLVVPAGVILTVPSGIVIRVTGDVTINGTIRVASTSLSATTPAGFGTLQASQVLHPSPLVGGVRGDGTNFGVGGQGGGSFAIYAGGNITVGATGLITANGADAPTPNPSAGNDSPGGGGGGGGVLVLLARGTVTVDAGGTIQANGGNGAAGHDSGGGGFGNLSDGAGGGGGGGIVHLVGSTVNDFLATVQVQGGTAGAILTTTAPSGGGTGGASAGAGGSGAAGSTSPAQPGSAGMVFVAEVPDPEDLLF
jgi:hypothetical protein